MKKFVVTTSIHPVTEALRKFQKMPDWTLIVVGDHKTPKDFKLERGIYLSPEMQASYDIELSEAIGWNCIQRRNFGLLLAHDMRADIVAVVDDDNIPLPHWGQNLLLGKSIEVNFYEHHEMAFDPMRVTNYPHLWHRGFPLQSLSQRNYTACRKQIIVPDVQADFWNQDPDIDAICRMEHAPVCTFDDAHFPFASNGISPFNSQNTFLSKKVLKDYFLFPHVGRMDDIWAAFNVQFNGGKVVYQRASVVQKRNDHDFTEDMKGEYLGYENNYKIIQHPDKLMSVLPPRSQDALRFFKRHFSKASNES